MKKTVKINESEAYVAPEVMEITLIGELGILDSSNEDLEDGEDLN